MYLKRRKSVFILSATISVAALGAVPALAESAEHPLDERPVDAVSPGNRNETPRELEEVVVTVTRVDREGYDAPTPTTVVGADVLDLRAPSVLVDALARLPAFRNTATPTTGGTSVAGAGGQSFVNMRGLGPNRTLVLLNGQRFVPTTADGVVDIAMFPSALIDRIEVVTGGASAAYGSDAVAGVANFILDTDLVGLKSELQGGMSTRGDAESQKVSVAWGRELGDRFHLMLGSEYYNSEGAGPQSRDWAIDPVWVVPNPNFTPGSGQPARLLQQFAYFAWASPGGVITSGPLQGTEFLRGGETRQFDTCSFSSGPFQVCDSRRDDRGDPNQDTAQAATQERATGYARATFEVTSDMDLYVDALYGQSRTSFITIPYASAFQGALTIHRDNAFLPEATGNQMDALGITAFTLGRYSRDQGSTQIRRTASTARLSAGIDADLGAGWKVDAYGAYGIGEVENRISNFLIPGRLVESADAIISADAGEPICRSTLANPGNGCVPVNLFGDGSPSAAAEDYFLGISQSDLRSKQAALGVNLTGEPVATWAGPVSTAVGVEYRNETVDQGVDPVSLAGRFASNPQQFDGEVNVKEIYGETVIPLADGLDFAEKVEINAAARYTDYSTSGAVTTWKLGGNWSPFQDLRFRATNSRDIRAPNITELFTPRQAGVFPAAITDPQNGNRQILINVVTGGNPDLDSEKANTTSLGVVFEPSFLQGLSASVDYYEIAIDGAIQTITAQEIVDRCVAGSTELCERIARDESGQITGIDGSLSNIGKVTTSGFDLEVSYRFPLAGGSVSLRSLLNYADKFVVDDGSSEIDQVGDIGTFALPQWSGDFTAIYRRESTTFLVNASYIGEGYYSKALKGQLEPNDVEAVWYLNATAERTFNISDTEMAFYISGSNLLDEGVPFGFGRTGGGNYDRIGRAIKIGFKVQM